MGRAESCWSERYENAIPDRARSYRHLDSRPLLTQKDHDKRWVAHFKDLLNQPVPDMPLLDDDLAKNDELVVDTGAFTSDETKAVIKSLKGGKTASALQHSDCGLWRALDMEPEQVIVT